ncbi:MAG: DUF305 domain-containing protein [Gemmatimonadota bacterium]
MLLFLSACGGSAASTAGGDATPVPAEDPRIVQAGAPGESSQPYAGGALSELEGASYTDADVAFMQGMIHHHAQALEMTALISERTTNRAIHQMGLRMEISQADEIAIMERWLRDRDLEVPEWGVASGEDHAAHHEAGHEMMEDSDDHAMMPGMLTPAQMAQLEAAEGRDFDRLFLELMIQHHEGAIDMVLDLYNSAGSAQESVVFQFASEIDADQTIEIRRMRELLQAWR